MKLPTVPPRGNLPQSLNDKIGRLRTATGKAERCDMLLFCSSDRAMPMFTCTFERMHPGEPFKLTEQGKAGGGAGGQGKATAATFRLDEFAPFATHCPYCGDGGRIDCQGCGKRYCQGGIFREKGREMFRCPTCKDVSGIVTSGGAGGTVTVMKAASADAAPAGLLGHVKQGLLPGRK